MQAKDIQSPEDLTAWLNEWPEEDGPGGLSRQQVAAWVSYRAAMRVLPGFWDWILRYDGVTALPVLRILLLSSVAAKKLNEENRLAVLHASAAATNAYDGLTGHAPEHDSEPAAGAYAAAKRASKAIRASRGPDGSDVIGATHGADAATLALGVSPFAYIAKDAVALEKGEGFFADPLWAGDETPFGTLWQEIQAKLPHSGSDAAAPHPEDWTFWIKWYEDALNGRPINWSMLEEVASTITDEQWDAGASVVNPILRGIWEKYHEKGLPEIGEELAQVRKSPAQAVEIVRAAMERNRKELPPTFDAIEALILIEIERLQKRNYRDDEDQEEAKRQIGIYLTLYETIGAMRSNLPSEGAVTSSQAEETDRLYRLFGKKLSELPREKLDEVVEGVWETGKGTVQFGLVSGFAYLGTNLLGMPPVASVSVAALCFAPKKAGEIIKLAKDQLSGK